MGQVFQCWWRICRDINVFFFRFEYHMFCVLYPFLTYLLTLPRTYHLPNFMQFHRVVRKMKHENWW
jgi:hypothetical protein